VADGVAGVTRDHAADQVDRVQRCVRIFGGEHQVVSVGSCRHGGQIRSDLERVHFVARAGIEYVHRARFSVGNPESPIDGADDADRVDADLVGCLHTGHLLIEDRHCPVTGVGNVDLRRQHRVSRRDVHRVRTRAERLWSADRMRRRINRPDRVVGVAHDQ
jgi:hypothetical protein